MAPYPHRSKTLCLVAALLAAMPMILVTVLPNPSAALPVGRFRRATLPRRVAVFTAETDDANQPCTTAVLDVLSQYHVGRMVFRGSVKGDLPLRGVNGSPLFSLVVVCNAGGRLLTGPQRGQLAEYQREFGTRRVAFAADPDDEPGMRSAGRDGGGGSCCDPGVEQRIRWFPPAILAEADVHFEKHFGKLQPMSSVGLPHTPAVVLDRSVVTPVLAFEPLLWRFPNETIAAAVALDDGAESLVHFFDLALSETATRLGEMWFQWGLRTDKSGEFTAYRSPVRLPPG